MKWKLDENLPSELADDLRAAGHDADTVLGESIAGTDDESVAQPSARERRGGCW